jgi:alpha-amylase
MKKGTFNRWLICLILFVGHTTYAQQVMMQGWYWDYPKTATGSSWADTLRLKAASLAQAGITDIWFPPHAVASSGPTSNGYDPQDLFIGNTTTGLGTRAALNNMLGEFTAQGIRPVADVVFNHRDGGKPEANPPVQQYITNLYTAAKEPYPSDRFRCILPLGGNSGNGAGDYYFKISSKSQNARFFNYGYKVYMNTNKVGYQNLSDQTEMEPNGGGDCGQPDNNIQLGRNMVAYIDSTGCTADEFHLSIAAGDFNASGDTLYIYLTNTNGYADQRIYGIWCGSCNSDVVGKLIYQTYTDFSGLPSGRGQMNYNFFKPNDADLTTTYLSGDWDQMYFYYDYDQFQPQTADTLISYAKWNWTDLGVRGFRMDAAKHFTPSFVSQLLNELHDVNMDPPVVVGELYTTNTADLSNWVNTVIGGMNAGAQAAIHPKVFDFSLRENLRQACDVSSFDARNIFLGSAHDASGLSGYNVITFVNNHDFRDASGFASLIHNNPLLGYAYILTNNQLGLPSIFYPDYYSYPGGPNFSSYVPAGLPVITNELNELMNVFKTYVNNSPQAYYLNRFNTPYASNFSSGSSDKSLIYQMKSPTLSGTANSHDVLVAINFGNTPLQVTQQIDDETGSITSGSNFYKVAGTPGTSTLAVDQNKQVTMTVPPRSYGVWVQSTVPLALNLIQFSAAAQANNTVLTQWTVADDKEAAFYEIQRKIENDNDYVTIGKLQPKGIDGNINYNFIDMKPLLNEAMLYRLKITGKNGQEMYSDIQLVRINKDENGIKIKGNPVRNSLDLSIVSSTTEKMDLYIVDASGKTLKTQSCQLANGVQTKSIDMSDIAAGHYILVAKSQSVNTNIPFIKQ